MSETKFTPEPWKAVSDQRWEAINIVDGNSQLFALVKGEANAALITAAPEMYDVLQHYFDLLEQANNGDAVAECKLFEDIVLIEQVLMKARGEA